MEEPLSRDTTDLTGVRRFFFFSVSLVLVAALIFVVGWFTDVRTIAAGAIVSAASFALLPFVIIAIGIALTLLIMALCVFVAIASAFMGGGGGDAGGAEIGLHVSWWGVRLVQPFYRWLGRRKHPVFWGVLVGVVAGSLALGSVVWFYIVPRETSTAVILAETHERLLDVEQKQKSFPESSASTLLWADLGEGKAGPVLDAFGRPLQYKIGVFKQTPGLRIGEMSVSGGSGISFQWRSDRDDSREITWGGDYQRFVLRSLGFDGKESDDDLLVRGISSRSTTNIDDTIHSIKELTGSVKGAVPTLKQKLHGLRRMREAAQEDD